MATTIKCWLMISFYLICISDSNAEDIPPPAYQLVAYQADIPSAILYAIALTESGLTIDKKMYPWPWTLNIAGRGHFYKSRHDACMALNIAITKHAAKRIDVGIAQINLGYHGQHFNDACELLDPYVNLAIAAQLLHQHYHRQKDWFVAIGHYHAPTNQLNAKRYRNIVNQHLMRIIAQDN